MTDRAAWRVEVGDCLDVLERMPAESVDAVVTDPPYGLGFMGVAWDTLDGRETGHQRRSAEGAFDHVGGNHNPENALDAARTRATENRRAQDWHERWARACLRIIKPGGFLLAFGGTRTVHRLACAVEDAGFEIRDRVLTLNGNVLGSELDWLYGTGWPKSLDIGKAIDKAAGVEREVVGRYTVPADSDAGNAGKVIRSVRSEGGYGGNITADREGSPITAPATPEAEEWEGWGTALKPAHEPIVVARKPFRGTLVAQVLATGTGALNIDACRIDVGAEQVSVGASDPANRRGVVGRELQASSDAERNQAAQRASAERANRLGRWPANVALLHAPGCERVGVRRVPSSVTVRRRAEPGDTNGRMFKKGAMTGPDVTYADPDGLETVEAWDCEPGCPIAALDAASGELRSGIPTAVGDANGRSQQNAYMGESRPAGTPIVGYGDAGGASRFFYSGKASALEREAGLDGFEPDGTTKRYGTMQEPRLDRVAPRENWTPRAIRNTHPTVKPIDLMRWLVRLIAPPGGVVLDPFAGSGSTGCAAALEGFTFVGVERDEAFAAIARARIDFWARFPVGTPTAQVLGEVGAVRRSRDESEARRAELASAGQLDLLAGAEGWP